MAKTTTIAGNTFLFTGKLTEFTREDAEAHVEAEGGKVLSGVSAKLNYLVVGEAEKLVSRLTPCIKNFGKVEYLATIESGFLDRFMHWINPFGNENQTYYIYKFDRK